MYRGVQTTFHASLYQAIERSLSAVTAPMGGRMNPTTPPDGNGGVDGQRRGELDWGLSAPGLPALPDGWTPTPPVAADPHAHAKSARWIIRRFAGATARGHAARARLAQVTDETLIARRRQIAADLRQLARDKPAPRRFRGTAQRAIEARALLIELADTPAEIRELIIECEAIGAHTGIEVER